MLLTDVSNYVYVVTEDYLIKTPKKEEFKQKPRKVEPIKNIDPNKHLGHEMDLYA